VKPPRVALITRRYWPLVGGAEVAMANLADEFKRLGLAPVIVTAQWESHWPREVVHREIPVVRLPQPQIRGLGTLRYMWELSRWLRKNRGDLKGVLVSMLKHDAYATLATLSGTNVPVVLRAEGAGESGDCRFHETARFGMRMRGRCQQATGVIAPSEAIERELLAAGFDRSRVHYVANGVAQSPTRHEARKRAAREALAMANSDLLAQPNDPVAVFTGRLHEGKGLIDLIRAWRKVVNVHSRARLWIVGEGPQREALFNEIREQELLGAVLLPGSFDTVEDVLAAADLFLLPSYEEGMSLSLLEAMAAGVPVIASDIPGNRRLITHEQTGLLLPVREPDLWATTILRVLSVRSAAATRAEQARRVVEQEYSLERMARRHAELLGLLQ
jgi:glycosyltransferase involved in cell wall biosynthesis